MQLEFHLYETQWMLYRGKYKNFLAISSKHITQHYLCTELPNIQLQIQLIRRLLYCRLHVLRKYFIKFPTKQHKILGYLDTSMALCHTMQAHLVKCQDVLTDNPSSCNRKLKFKQFSNEYASPRSGRLKQYMAEFENEPWERKSQKWYHFQEQSLFVFIQEVLMYQYMYFKLTNLKEAVRFLQKLVQLKFVKVYKSILLFNEALTLLNTAYFELSYSFQNVILEPVSSLLIEAIKEYYRPKSNQEKCKRQMKQLTQLLVVNLDLQSKSLEYKDKYDQTAQVISMANFFCQHVLCFVGKQNELINYIQNEYEYKHEKYEQVILEQQDLNWFVSFLLGTKICTYQKEPQTISLSSAKFSVESKNQYYTVRSRNEFGNSLHTPSSTPRSFIHLKKCKSPESQSYLSKLINLRNLSDHKYDLQNKETEIQKHLRKLMEKLHKLESPEQFRTIDEVFHNKVHQITFEKCLTLDQVKETARKIIGAEWEVHKEMPVTKSLMKLISVSDIQLEGQQQQYNKLQEYMELQKIDFHNTQKDEAQLKLKENKDLKKLQINQQKYQMKLRHQKVQQQLQIPKKLLSLQTDETGLSPKFLKRNTIIMNNIQTSMFERLDPNERRGKEFRSAQKQLMDLMVQNLEQRDEIDNQKQRGHFVNVLPKSITRIPSPTAHKIDSSDCKKSFAFSSNNSTRLEITKL